MLQKIIIIGNVGRDPEMRYTPAGQAVTSFNVAANNKYKNKGGELVEETVWFRIEAWGATADTCNQYVRKGMLVYVEGRVKHDPATGGPRIWTDKDGNARASYEVTASTVRFLNKVGDHKEEHQEVHQEEELPF